MRIRHCSRELAIFDSMSIACNVEIAALIVEIRPVGEADVVAF